MTRTQIEDAIIAILKAALPTVTVVESMPLGMDDKKALDVRDTAVRVVYVGSAAKPNQALGTLVQQEQWSWSVIILAKAYRSPKSGVVTALPLLESTITALAGVEIGDGQMLKVRDQIMTLPEGCGLIGYEAIFTIQTYLRRTA